MQMDHCQTANKQEDGGVQAWLVLSVPAADEGSGTQREPGYLAALVYVSLCPQHAWYNTRSASGPQRFQPVRACALQVCTPGSLGLL